jgi:type II secretory ATPase GspE/PulE/Tfp pilus assembly ATPase PilB-like protein
MQTLQPASDKSRFFLDELPPDVRGRVVIFEGTLHASDEIDRRHVVDLLAKLRHHGVVKYELHKPSVFQESYAKYVTRELQSNSEIAALVKAMIARAHAKSATDIHVIHNGAFARIRFRVLGLLCEDIHQLDAGTGDRLIRATYEHLGDANDTPVFVPTERNDGVIVKREILPEGVHAIRIHTEPMQSVNPEKGLGTHMSLRLLFDATKAEGTLQERMGKMGFLDSHIKTMELLLQRKGMIVIAGETGQGKTTVATKIMEYLTEIYPEKSYHSIEDPPERMMKNVQQIPVVTKQNKESWGLQARSAAFLDALAGALRSDMDWFFIGEMRYPEAVVTAIEGALSGHKIITTTHAGSGLSVFTRFARMLRRVNDPDPLGAICDINVLSGVTCQCLIAKLCPDCKRLFRDLSPEERAEAVPSPVLSALERVSTPDELWGKNGHPGVHVRGPGCVLCDRMGLLGQTVVAEVIAMDQRLLSLLRQDKMVEAYRYWKTQEGAITYIEHAVQLIKAGMLDPYIATLRLGVSLDFNPFFDAGIA